VSGARRDVVDRARLWVGTPYVHQARRCGVGCDCLGLVLGVWEDRFGTLPASPPGYTPDWSEADGAERLWRAAEAHLEGRPLSSPEVGDVLLFRMRQGAVAKHLGIQSAIGADARFIHAYSGRGVVESRLTATWARRIVARFEFPKGP
jgi:NlpC/P60 family putative phage cell wall peptidase